MLYYDRIDVSKRIDVNKASQWKEYVDVSERIDVNKASQWKEYDICHYWYFLENISTVCL